VFTSPANFQIWFIDKKAIRKLKNLSRVQPNSNRYFASHEPYTTALANLYEK
tara:strand:+ start:3650 stop:3805 length:156 start_codon:yes stop_codon:yes gene_type:complete